MTTEDIWSVYQPRLSMFIHKYIADTADVDDVLQEVFVKIHTHVASLRDEKKLQSWIYQIARNAIMDYYRQQKRSLLLETLRETEEHDMFFDDVVRELAPCIREMVEHLPEKYRQALLLTEYEGLTQKELSVHLGISFSGAKSRVQRAREQLKDLLLACCDFQFDRLNHVIDYQPRLNCC